MYLRTEYKMKKRISFFVLMGIFWLLFFEVCRTLFLAFHFRQSMDLSAFDFLMILSLGLRMDAAMAAYWLITTGLLFTFSPFLSNLKIYRTHNLFVIVLLLFSCLIVITDLELYKHWGFRMNTTPLFYVGKEAAGSVNSISLVILIILFSLLFASFLLFYWRKLAPQLLELTEMPKSHSVTMFLVTGLLFIPIRSSFDVAPLNTGVVYYHKTKTFPNHAGINVVWNFLKSVQSDNDIRYPSTFYSGNAEEQLTQWIAKDTDTTQRLVNQQKPNVILIVMESFTAKIIEPLGGEPGVTPNLNRLVKEGVLFSNFYSSGDRTDKGLVSILSAYPAQPRTSIIKFPEKTQGLNFLPREMAASGYHTSFVYGGNIGFANMESYLTLAGFSHITQDDDFDDSIDRSKWGVADHYVFNRLLQEADTATNPFFKVMLSLSSHEPFEVPMQPVFKGNDERALFLNACYYADKSLGEFIGQAKTKPWWQNTLIIITADHGHRFPNPEELKDKKRFKIPMLWLGGAIDTRGTVISTLGGHTDIANTILGQVDHVKSNFMFSKNMLSLHAKPFAIYIFNNGYGLLTPEKESIYDFDLNNYLRKEGTEEELDFAKAYLQTLFTDYNQR